MTPSRDIGRLLAIMAALRTPKTGCPWDLEQNFATIAPYTLEEAYEVADAIVRDDLTDLKEELGDLLLQVVFHARMAEELGAFDFGDVVEVLTAKLIRRHPHVFGQRPEDQGSQTPQAVEGLWERIKAQEKQAKAGRGGSEHAGALAGVPLGLPALTRALKLQDKASKVGFDWNDPRAAQNPRGSRRNRSRARWQRSRRRGRSRRSSVRRRQSRAPSARGSGSGVAGYQPEIRAPLRRDRAGIGG
jgi:ATP diphosphatase